MTVTNTTSERVLPWIGLIARLALGGVLFVAGAIKIPYPYKAAAAMRAYELLPNSFASIFGYILPWFEVGLGLLLILGVATRLSGLIGALLMILFMCGMFVRGHWLVILSLYLPAKSTSVMMLGTSPWKDLYCKKVLF